MQQYNAMNEWSAEPASKATSRTDAARLHDAEPMDFILSSNWVLRTEGVKRFYEVLYKKGENLEIKYDHILHAFRVKCLSHEEVRVVSVVKDTLDKVVQEEAEKGIETSSRITSLADWRKDGLRLDEEVIIPTKYSFPCDVAACRIQDTWDIPEAWFMSGITTTGMLPERALSKLQGLTGAVLITSSNRRTVYVGGSRIDKVADAKRKLSTLARFFSLIPRNIPQVVEIFLYDEGERSTTGEYRYVADGNDKLLRSYILDRFDWPHPVERYPTVFLKSVLVRLNPHREPWKDTQLLSDTVLPVVKESQTEEGFAAFGSNVWKYPTKSIHSGSSLPISDVSTTQLGRSPSAPQHILRPEIESWVSKLPVPNGHGPGSSRQKYSAIVSQTPEKATEHLASSTNDLIDISTPPTTHSQSETNEPDPFKYLWNRYRPLHTAWTPNHEEDRVGELDPKTSLSMETHGPQIAQNDERASRPFHVTVNQKAGSPVDRNTFPPVDPDMVLSISRSLAVLMEPLRMWSGIVDLRIDLGRFYFLNVKASHIQDPGDDDEGKRYKLSRIRTELNNKHKANDKLLFTRVLTNLGAEANYLAHMRDERGKEIWRRPGNKRSSTYEFICRSKTLEGVELNFIVSVDAMRFSSGVKQFKPDQNCFAVHCTKHVWDFRLVLSVSQNLDDTCVRFAEELVGSLRVMPQNDGIPELDVSYDKGYDVEILAVRTRNTACCTSEISSIITHPTHSTPHTDVQRLYISEVWEMALRAKSDIEQRTQLKFARYKNNERPGMPLLWYEAVLKSDTFSMAFEQNEKLEFGEEVRWTTEELVKTGAVWELIRTAAFMVKKMDGVGFWNDNHQAELQHRVISSRPAVRQNTPRFW
ncbi:hypothetical protein F5X98DRAFT_385034 [Xylaria grammica]|nr:hypothetical protein F5X98DRAFT_385034 [Xylaria grammica]